MADKKITPHQLRKNLAYVQHGAPDFMRMLTGQSSTAANKDPRNPYKKPIGIEAKFQTEQSDDDDEPAHDLLNDREEERPTVVVLKDGKHLDERQVRNVLKNLPPGLSEAEIQKRLAEELEKHHDGQAERSDGEEEEDDEQDDQSPSVDENGKILFRRPKGSKLKGKTGSASSSKKNFEETLLGDARAKANDLKRKAGSSGGAASSQPSTTASSSSSKSTAGDTTKKKKQKTAKTTSLLSFDNEE
ncbi:hypothetical protein BGX34_004233 [Mortierella sp. NVP85]|nr:hypothetical protein BGX34_004233 [Mortierella sp. NVP85]